MTYELLLFFHIIGALLLAAGAVLGLALSSAMRATRTTSSIRALIRAEAFLPGLMIAGALLSIISGTALVSEGDFEFSEAWISTAYAGWLIAGAIGGGYLGRRARSLAALAEREAADGREDSEVLRAAVSQPGPMVAEWLMLAIVVGFVALMVFKPGS